MWTLILDCLACLYDHLILPRYPVAQVWTLILDCLACLNDCHILPRYVVAQVWNFIIDDLDFLCSAAELDCLACLRDSHILPCYLSCSASEELHHGLVGVSRFCYICGSLDVLERFSKLQQWLVSVVQCY